MSSPVLVFGMTGQNKSSEIGLITHPQGVTARRAQDTHTSFSPVSYPDLPRSRIRDTRS